jgi:hypothetical protein
MPSWAGQNHFGPLKQLPRAAQVSNQAPTGGPASSALHRTDSTCYSTASWAPFVGRTRTRPSLPSSGPRAPLLRLTTPRAVTYAWAPNVSSTPTNRTRPTRRVRRRTSPFFSVKPAMSRLYKVPRSPPSLLIRLHRHP